MTDEKLIDALAKITCAIEGRTHGFTFDEVVAPGIERWTRHRYEAEILLRDIQDAGYVFEKAHTPTDDEREADEKEILNALYDSREAFRGVGAEVGTDETAILVDDVPDIVFSLGFRRSVVPEPSACPSCLGACEGGRHCCDNCEHAEPQGEPSDALSRFGRRRLDEALAGLRAASAVSEQGENGD